MLLEEIDKRFDVVAEGHAAVVEKLDATFEAVGALQEDVGVLKTDVGVLKGDMTDVKEQLDLIRGDLKAKADRAELQLLEQRVTRLERRFASA